MAVVCLGLQGDYNMTPDRHLGAASIDKCRPDLLISESTYATTIRDSKRCRERDFLKKVHDCVDKGGKVSTFCRKCPSLHLFVCLSIHLLVRLCLFHILVHLLILFVCLPVCLLMHIYQFFDTCLSIPESVHVLIPVCLSVDSCLLIPNDRDITLC